MKGLYKLILESTMRYPDKAFVQSTDHIWTYNETECMARNVSEYLLQYGIRKGDRVVIFCDNSIQYIASFFGILRVDAVAVPVNPAKMLESFLYIMEKSTPGLILTCGSAAGKLDKIRESLCADIINIDSLDIWRNPGHTASFGDGQLPDADDNDSAVILFTSGTTSHPKGVTLTHGNLLANTEAIVDYLKLTGEDSVLMTLPFTYSYGNSVLLTHAYAGASIFLENSTAFPYKVLEGIRRHKVSGFSTVGSYINLMLKCMKNSQPEVNFFENLRYLTLAGEATNNEDIRFLSTNYPNLNVYVMYGQTEASARLSYLSPERLHTKLGSVGKGLCNVELRVVNDAGNDINPGELGEIIAYGPNIMKGYWGDPAATGEILRDGWLYTGDTATVDEDGYIYIKGRKTDIIKHMGHRISPVEIENVINSSCFIKESAVIESIHEGLPVIKAFIVFEKECSVEEIRKYTHSKLPIYMRPHIFEITGQLPRTDSGKIRRSALRSMPCAE